jgi:hypothetical protein
MKSPPRMREDVSLAPELRTELECALSAPETYDLTAGAERLEAALASFATPGAETVSTPPADAGSAALAAEGSAGLLGATGAKLGIAAVAAAVISAGAIAWTVRERTPPPERAPVATVASAKPVPPAQAVPPPSPAPAPPAPPAAPSASQLSGMPDGDAALRRETSQLGRIKHWLTRDPARAFALAQAGHREFPRGMLREEREALAVLALWNMGRDEEARRRAEAFLARHPSSAVRGQIERRLALQRRQDDPAR